MKNKKGFSIVYVIFLIFTVWIFWALVLNKKQIYDNIMSINKKNLDENRYLLDKYNYNLSNFNKDKNLTQSIIKHKIPADWNNYNIFLNNKDIYTFLSNQNNKTNPTIETPNLENTYNLKLKSNENSTITLIKFEPNYNNDYFTEYTNTEYSIWTWWYLTQTWVTQNSSGNLLPFNFKDNFWIFVYSDKIKDNSIEIELSFINKNTWSWVFINPITQSWSIIKTKTYNIFQKSWKYFYKILDL